MKKTQKIIKYLAIAFALFLTFSIISIISYGVSFIGNLFDNKNNLETLEELKNLEIETNISSLNIDISSTNMIIKVGDTFKAETSNKYIKYKQDGNIMYINEEKHNLFNADDNNTLIIYIPKDIILDEVSINSGAGKIDIEQLSSKILRLNLGAGKTQIKCLNISDNTIVDTGAGELSIDNSSLNNLDLNMGVGKFMFTGQLFGKTEIDQGIGTIDLNLLGSKDDYQIHLDKGLGSVKIDGNNINNDETLGNGNNKIDIDGGIGSIEINFTKNI